MSGSDEMAARFLAQRRSVLARLRRAAGQAGRAVDDITLIAVSKTLSPASIRVALRAGHRVFAENRVQEAQAKWPALKRDFPDAQVHLIGALQSNKARAAMAIFDAIHSLDRPKLAQALADEMADQAPDLFIQVNTGSEAQKSGVLLADVPDFIALCRDTYGLPVSGLMCLPPKGAVAAPHFALLAQIAADCGLKKLSMGMSDDFEQAIFQGATHIRIGRALFENARA